MNRFYNILIFIVSFIAFPLTLSIGLNEDWTLFGLKIPGVEFEHKDLFFGIVSALVALLFVFKAKKKWTSLIIIKQKQRFDYHTGLSKARQQRVMLYSIIEIVFILFIGYFFSNFNEVFIWLAPLYFIGAVEHVVHLIYGISGKNYGIGITNKALLSVDREIYPVYFKGVKSISKQQNNLYFDYGKDLIIHFPLELIPTKELPAFYNTLLDKIDVNKVFFQGEELQKLVQERLILN